MEEGKYANSEALNRKIEVESKKNGKKVSHFGNFFVILRRRTIIYEE